MFAGQMRRVFLIFNKVIRVFDAPLNFARNLSNLLNVPETDEILSKRPVGANVPALGLSNKAVFTDTDQDLVASVPADNLTHPPFEEYLIQNTLWPEVEKMYGHVYEIISICANHKYVATASKATKNEHAKIRIWATDNWLQICEPLEFHSLTITSLDFSSGKSNFYFRWQVPLICRS
jgi:elongator complex protein 2